MTMRGPVTIAALTLLVSLTADFAIGDGGADLKGEGSLRNALPVEEKPIPLDQPKASSYNNRGVGLYFKDDYDAAIACFDEAIRLEPDYASAFCNRGSAWADKGDLDRAIADYDDAIKLNPRSSTAFNNRANAWKAKGKLDNAFADYDEAIRIDPKFAGAYNNRASAWRRKGEVDKACADYDEAIRLHPTYAFAYKNRGSAWFDRGELDKALADYDEAIRLHPKLVWAHIGKGVVHWLRGEAEALEAFKTAIVVDGWRTDDSLYAALYGHVAADELDNSEQAKRFLDEAAPKLPDSWPHPIIDLLRGESDEATTLARATSVGEQTDFRYFAGLARRKNDDLAGAKEHFRWVAEEGDKSHTAYRLAVTELERLDAAENSATP